MTPKLNNTDNQQNNLTSASNGNPYSNAPSGFDISNTIQTSSISLPKGGGALRNIDEKFQVNASNGTASFSALLPFSKKRNDLPTEWYAFLNPVSAADDQVLSLNITPDRFPFFAASGSINIKAVELVADNSDDPGLTAINNLNMIAVSRTSISGSLQASPCVYGKFLTMPYAFYNQKPGFWRVINSHTKKFSITSDKVSNFTMILHVGL